MLDIFMSRLPLILGVIILALSVLEICRSARRQRNERYSRPRTDRPNRDRE